MSQTASAPAWVKGVVVGIGLVSLCAGWLYVAGHGFVALTFGIDRGPAADLTTWPRYWLAYRQQPATHSALLKAALGATVLVLSPLALLFLKPRQALHGEARFARRGDIRKAGLLGDSNDGIIVGRIGAQFLTAGMADYPHVMLAAPTGSGKGVGVVIPNLLNWNHSVIVLDIKQENWTLTAGFRKQCGHDVFLFDPASTERRTHRWNPLAYVRDDPGLRVDDVQKIGNIVFPDVSGTDPIWTASCRSLFLGLVLYVFETAGVPRTLGQVAREAFGDDEALRARLDLRYQQGMPLSPACESTLADYLNTADVTRTSIRKTFTSRFELFLNPNIDAATADNDFDLNGLRRRRMSIYIGITPDNLSRMAPILNLFFQQVVDLNTRELPEHNPALKFQCLLILDEFRALGKLPLIVEAIAFLRGYGVRLLPIFQSPSQVREVYGDDAAKSFFQNHALRVSYTPADIDTATEISRELGNNTVKSSSVSRPFAFGQGQRTVSDSEQSRALLLPQEAMALGADEVLLFPRGHRPIRATKIRWYLEPVFKRRIVSPPTVPTAPMATLQQIPVASAVVAASDA
jgi:type IV secretion system protein VirD4